MAIVDFESICVGDEISKNTETKTRIGKRSPKPVSKSLNLLEDLMFLSEFNRTDLSSSFVDAPENLATKSKGK